MMGSSSARRALKLVKFRAPGSSTGHVCAVIWCEGQRVHLASPLVHASSGAIDPLPFIRQFPDAFEMGPLFERAMEWLDSICYAAANTKEVQSACEAQPEWGLSCERYDGGDALLGLGGLTRHPEPLELLPQATMRYGLAEILQRILRADPLFEGAQLGLDPDAEVFCAEVVLERPRTVCVTLCAQVQPRDAVWHGVLEHSRLVRGDDPELSALLILPRLQVGRAMRLTPRVVLAGLALEQVRHGLHLLVAEKAT
jgi:hypothetical protein